MTDENMIRLINALINRRTGISITSLEEILNTQPDTPGNPIDDDKLNRIKSQFSVLNNNFIKEKLKNQTCSICLEEYKTRQHFINLGCNHGFHKKCIIKWLKSYNQNCPICRKDLS